MVMTSQNEMLDNIQIEERDPRIHISPSGELAWATSLWQFHATAAADTMNLPVRCTWVLQKQDGQWKVVHFHKSLPAG
jgi:ketosteroid isomerase-like protein